MAESDPLSPCKYEQLDIVDKAKFEKLVKDNGITYIVHLAAIISSLGEKNPQLAYDVNVTGATNGLDIARDHGCKIYVPSSIAVFGGDNF